MRDNSPSEIACQGFSRILNARLCPEHTLPPGVSPDWSTQSPRFLRVFESLDQPDDETPRQSCNDLLQDFARATVGPRAGPIPENIVSSAFIGLWLDGNLPRRLVNRQDTFRTDRHFQK
jgi:hypothetical protein